MLMLNAYFDESGHGDDPNTPFFGIAGCLGTAERWEDVEIKWKAILKRENIPYWHMSEYAHSLGVFKSWEGDEARRKRVYGELWKIIIEARPFVTGCFMQVKNYNQILTNATRDSLQDLYFLCFLQVLAFPINFLTKDDVPLCTIATVFDTKKGFMDYAYKLYEGVMDLMPVFREVIPPPVFRDMRQIVQLQIADIIAYEAYKEFERRLNSPDRKPRWGVERLQDLINLNSYGQTKTIGDDMSPIMFHSDTALAEFSQWIGGSRIDIPMK